MGRLEDERWLKLAKFTWRIIFYGITNKATKEIIVLGSWWFFWTKKRRVFFLRPGQVTSKVVDFIRVVELIQVETAHFLRHNILGLCWNTCIVAKSCEHVKDEWGLGAIQNTHH